MIALLILMASSLVTLERLKRVQGYISALSQLIPGPGRGGGERLPYKSHGDAPRLA